MSNVRDSPNLIRNDYGCGRWASVINYINKMQDKTIYIPPGPATIHSSKDYDLRIDLQGIFPDHSRANVTWFNIQVQENRARGGDNTTVFTTYVHKEGYESWSAHHLNSSTILKAMQQQALHQQPECCVFMTRNGNSISSARIPRSPDGISYTIWTP
ncbi:hypothetical protein ASPVEDRAFT_39107 [Aspergillus versicolor CBS 583.65]|uniref:Uncharacterized protein n=1 Tax=Aspergillus versicolor CBS 583.65 TaxID=1036611 RepID=A0A1L9PE03_ASPVE|nr:uncharacterized protein ASPVEDRAFT_39107 [Aspergillus versicolor CBS 583.65]OJI99729.1 hypothetical protein ASPVEDRAFT_39107 [Aspergillus versicolor CBS 583.65]